MENENRKECIVCSRGENQVPIIEMKYKGQKYYICPQHLPVLIHEPGKLTGNLPGADTLEAG